MLEWVQARLSSRHAPAAIIALALLLSAPVLAVGFDADDHFQLLSLREHPDVAGIARAPWDLYAYAKDRAANLALREEGVFPWWSDPDVSLKFFRPLASLSRWLDQTLWPEQPALMQLHSLLWFAALLYWVARIYRRLYPKPWLSGLALSLFAFDDARAATIGWLCNRNALIALTFGFAALLCHQRWRADRKAGWRGPCCLALGLLGGETALQVCGYLLAYALFLDRGSLGQRARSLVPYGCVVLIWAALYAGLGYGAAGSGHYLDPVREPLRFFAALPERLGMYTLTLFMGVSAEFWDILPLFGLSPRLLLLPPALLCIILLVAALAPLYRRDPLVRFWIVGTLLATLPACGVSPSDRMLTAAALGGSGLIASLFSALVERSYPAPRAWLTTFAGVLAFMNLGLAPVLLPYFAFKVDHFDKLEAIADASIPRTAEILDQTVVLLNPPFDSFPIFFPLYRETHHLPRPRHFRWLAVGVCDLRVERVDATTLKLTPEAGYLSNSSQLMLRSLQRPLQRGERVALSDVTFEVLSQTADERPAEVLAHFDRPLESPSFRWLQWGKHEYVPFRPPAIGQAVTLSAVDMASALRGPL